MSRKKSTQKPPAPQQAKREVEQHRRCPICFPNGGVGNAYHTRNAVTYYKCQKCGHTWSATVKEVETVIRHRETVVRTRESVGTSGNDNT